MNLKLFVYLPEIEKINVNIAFHNAASFVEIQFFIVKNYIKVVSLNQNKYHLFLMIILIKRLLILLSNFFDNQNLISKKII